LNLNAAVDPEKHAYADWNRFGSCESDYNFEMVTVLNPQDYRLICYCIAYV